MHKYTNTDKFTTTIVGFSQSCVEYFALVGILLCTGSGKLWIEAVVWKQGATNPLPRMKIGTYCNALLWFDKGVWFQYHALLCKYHYALHITLHIFLFIFAQSKMLCTSFAQIAMFFAFLTDVSGQCSTREENWDQRAERSLPELVKIPTNILSRSQWEWSWQSWWWWWWCLWWWR